MNTTTSIILTVVLAASCSGRNGQGPDEPNGDNGTILVTPPDGAPGLTGDSYDTLFEEDQAAYYIDHQDSIWLVLRLAEGSDDATLTKVVLHLLGRIAEEFDFSGDERAEVIILAYEGILEKKSNYGIKVEIADLEDLQSGKTTLTEVMKKLTEVVDINLIALKPYITD